MSKAISIIPKAALERYDPPKKVMQQLQTLDEYDLSLLTNNFVDKGRRFSPEQVYPILAHFGRADLDVARKLESEFRRFIALTLLRPGTVYAPSGPIDMYWHFFILHTRQYKEFCEKLWGAYAPHPRGFDTHYTEEDLVVDHEPADDDSRPTMRDAYNRTRELYEDVFGSPDDEIWTAAVATCGDSYSGFIPTTDELYSEKQKRPFE